jgi:hypothetical protein
MRAAKSPREAGYGEGVPAGPTEVDEARLVAKGKYMVQAKSDREDAQAVGERNRRRLVWLEDGAHESRGETYVPERDLALPALGVSPGRVPGRCPGSEPLRKARTDAERQPPKQPWANLAEELIAFARLHGR